ncbi:hypothetical protein D3C76_1855900 [compost metagenome]
MLGAAVIPYCHAVFLPTPTDLVLGVVGLANQVLQQVDTFLVQVLTYTDTSLAVVIHEMRSVGIDE